MTCNRVFEHHRRMLGTVSEYFRMVLERPLFVQNSQIRSVIVACSRSLDINKIWDQPQSSSCRNKKLGSAASVWQVHIGCHKLEDKPPTPTCKQSRILCSPLAPPTNRTLRHYPSRKPNATTHISWPGYSHGFALLYYLYLTLNIRNRCPHRAKDVLHAGFNLV